MRLVYLIGEPGVGKSTAVRCALPELAQDFGRDADGPCEMWTGTVNGVRVVYLGNPRHPAFPGTDRLSMSVQPLVLRWLAEDPTRPWVVVGEGDRLATKSFLTGAHALGVAVQVVHCHSHLAEIRRSARARRLKLREQSGSWVAGRRTKLTNLSAALATAGVASVGLCTSGSPTDVGLVLRRIIAIAEA